MLGSPSADLGLQCLRQFCCRSPYLTDHHLRRVLEQAVAPAFAVGRARLWAATRGSPLEALARQVAMYLAHVAFGLTFAEVARLFGRDPKTVAHACALVEDRRDCAIFDRALDLLEGAVRMLSPHPA
jgi:Bacterial dnaA protein helix-turn-helix